MLKIPTFIKKEVNWSSHRLVAICLLFLVVPALFATGTVFFEHTLPENSPIAITPISDDVTKNELQIIRGSLTFISDPVIVDSADRAFSQLKREEVYAVVKVPPDITTTNASATVDIYIHGSVTIFRLPSRAIINLVAESLDKALPADINATRHVIGPQRTLSEYLLPTFLMVFVMLVAFVYLPAMLAAEESVFDRLRMKSSLDALLAAKGLFFMALVVMSILVVYVVGAVLGYGLEPVSAPGIAVYLLTFVYLAALSTSIMLLTKFNKAGQVLNVGILFALIPLSNLAYPVGFFSPLSKTIARLNPLHYSMIIARSALLKETPITLFTDWLGGLVAVTACCLVVLKVTLAYYKHVQ